VANGLKAAVGLIVATASFALLQFGCAGEAQPVASISPHDAVVVTGASLGTMYRAVDRAVIDAYLASALLDPARLVGASEHCTQTDNSISNRPSVLANPPLAEAAIAQRVSLAEALAAYAVAAASVASDAPAVESALALSDVQRSAFELNVAAKQHAQGDLFIEDAAAAFAAAADRFAAAKGKSDVRQIVLETSPVIARLTTLLRSDVVREGSDAANAARLDYERWLAYDSAVGALPATRGAVAPATTLPIPRCLEPVIPTYAESPSPDLAAPAGANVPGRGAVLARLDAARARYDVLRTASAGDLVAALAALNDAAMNALRAGSDAAAGAALQGALIRFRTAAQTLAASYAPLRLGG
jgi:hypothetical protein